MGVRHQTILEVELLESRNAPAVIIPGPAANVPSAPPEVAATGLTSQTGVTNAPTTTFSPAATPQLPGQPNQTVFGLPANVGGLALAQLNAPGNQPNAGSVPLTTGLAPSAVLTPTFPTNPFALLPDNGGGIPANNSIPNAAATLSNRAGLNGLSPFLPTYYLNYTQVGPFYTGSDSPTLPQLASPSLNPEGGLGALYQDGDTGPLISSDHVS